MKSIEAEIRRDAENTPSKRLAKEISVLRKERLVTLLMEGVVVACSIYPIYNLFHDKDTKDSVVVLDGVMTGASVGMTVVLDKMSQSQGDKKRIFQEVLKNRNPNFK